VDQFGDLKSPDSVVGSGPWMLQRYEPNVRLSFVRNPNYYIPGLPYVDNVDIALSQDPAAGFAGLPRGRVRLRP
jgi:peptide/nickel transport system substrate-binding protein